MLKTLTKLTQLIEIKEKMVLEEPSSAHLSMPKLVGADAIPQIENGNDPENFHNKFEIFAIDNLLDDDWRKPIVEYLRNPTGNVDRKIRYKTLSYVIFENELFKKTAEGILLKCLNEAEAYIAISDVHIGACGSHQAGHKMKWLLFRQGLYWPSMLKNFIEY